MVMCARCHKRVAVVFMTKLENGKRINEGVCMKCAQELGLPLENLLGDYMNKMGVSPEQLAEMEEDINQMMAGEEDPEGGAPAINFNKLFGGAPQGESQEADEDVPDEQDKKAGKEKKKGSKKRKFLDTYCTNLTRRAANGELDLVVGRDNELARVIQILCRRQKNNPCLIGEPGVGKTAIAEALAQKIAAGDVPYKLSGKEVYLVDLTALVAGTQFRGQFEARMQSLLTEVKESGNIILVIDEVHRIVGSGEAEGGGASAANILKPALSRGEVQVLGATTMNEYRKYIEKDTALERRFQPVTVNEPSVEDTVAILRGIKHYYEAFHAIVIPDDLLYRAVVMSERYITDRYLPDKAIDLIDEAASHLSLSCAPLNKSYSVRDKLLALKSEREEAEGETVPENGEQEHYEKLAKIKSQELQLSTELKTLEEQCCNILMTEADLAGVVEIWTGIPATNITANEFEKLDGLEERLKQHIVGQDEAVKAVTRAVKRNRAGIAYKRKPVSFIFAGPTGVGKTELVKTLAADLFDSPETLIRLDMSEFMEKHSVSRIIGSPPGYVGYDEAGQLTEKIRRRPYSIVLFDEIEKAHPDVLNILLQILDDGRITDAHGKTVNFENTVIVMTTNAGSDKSGAFVGFAADEKKAVESKTEKALSSFLRPEFLNRIDEIVTFRSLDENDFVGIAAIMLSQLAEALTEKGITLAWDDAVASFIAKEAFSHKFGARNMRRYIQTHIEDPLAEQIISDYRRHVSSVSLSVEDGAIRISCL
ncbi:MAG: ATP-dependent Clp protease ATP-binding subunit [Clostridia bacterium]|nr:ATP-dependent Clp protease ATP-binding subunit [Clostridia bacterium]